MKKFEWPQGKGPVGKNQHLTIYLSDAVRFSHPILLIHGLWSTNKRWENYGRFFAEKGFLVLAPTLRHHYLNNKIPELGHVSINDYVDDIKNLIKEITERGLPGITTGPIPKPIVIGHSMGGLLSQKIAEAGLAEKLVLLSSAPPASIGLRPDLRYQLQTACYLPQLLFKKPFKMGFKVCQRYTLNNLPPAEQKIIFDEMVYDSGLAAREIFLKKINVDFEKITCPTLALTGTKDMIVPWRIAWEIGQKMGPKKCLFKPYSEFAHCTNIEAGWEKIAQDIFDWMKVS